MSINLVVSAGHNLIGGDETLQTIDSIRTSIDQLIADIVKTSPILVVGLFNGTFNQLTEYITCSLKKIGIDPQTLHTSRGLPTKDHESMVGSSCRKM